MLRSTSANTNGSGAKLASSPRPSHWNAKFDASVSARGSASMRATSSSSTAGSSSLSAAASSSSSVSGIELHKKNESREASSMLDSGYAVPGAAPSGFGSNR